MLKIRIPKEHLQTLGCKTYQDIEILLPADLSAGESIEITSDGETKQIIISREILSR